VAIGSGLAGSFGWSKESTYGTRVAPAKFIRHRTATFNREQTRVQGIGVQSGALGPRGDHYVETNTWATAQVDFDVATLNMLQLWENLMGTSTGPTLINGSSYSATFTLADNVGKMLTMQSNVPLRGGTNKAKEITGAKATAATFSVAVGELLQCSMEFDGRKYDTAQTLASPSYVSGVPFHFGQANLKLGTFSSETAVTGVRSFSATVSRPMDTEAFIFNNSGLKQEPVLNDLAEITGTITADYLATADFEDRFTGLTLPSLVFECVSTVAISGANYPTFRLTIPGVSIDGPAQNVDGYEVPMNDWNFQWRYDGTNLPSIYVVTSESSL
jgi:hypothetical protein